MLTRFRHARLAAAVLPALALDGRRRRLLAEMRMFVRRLPARLAAPLAGSLAELTPEAADLALSPAAVRRLADLAALLERRSPLGLCLRRSLVRYHYLRRAGVPLVINFGARFKHGAPDREIAGHAWVTLDGEPYFEEEENWRGFVVMMRHP